MRKIRSKKNNIQKVDKTILIYILLLVVFGLLMVYEASAIYANQTFGIKYRFVLLQSGWVFIGLLGAYFLSRIDLDFIKKHSTKIYILSMCLLVFVLLPTPFAPEVYGAQRWLVINPAPLPKIPVIGRIGFQPSEFAKLASIIFLSAVLTSQNSINLRSVDKLKAFLMILILSCGLVLLEPDFTTSFVLGGILMGVYFISGAPLIYFIIGTPILLITAAVYAFSSSYRRERIMTLFTPESIDKMDAGYHIRQIMIALGSGGLFGLGFGKSRQKYSYLPEVTSDSIFAVVGEEFGFIGTILVIMMFVLLIWRGITIASKCDNKFGSLVVSGVMIWIIIQTIINLGAMVRILPLTGVPLPLVSYGGSSTIFILFGLGLVLNVSRYLRADKS